MHKSKIAAFRKERAAELTKLANILIDKGVISDPGPVNAATSDCRMPSGDSWGYRMNALRFIQVPQEASRKARPLRAEILGIELSVNLRGPCLEEYATQDPFKELEVDLSVQGLVSTEGGNKNLYCAWHLDRHITGENGKKKERGKSTPGIPSAAHPLYHFQYGGRQMWERMDLDYGQHLLPEPPRLAHPPLDAILAVDLVLSNYYGEIWQDLHRNHTQYAEITYASQTRYWRPYAISTTSLWKGVALDKSWESQKTWPQLSRNCFAERYKSQ